MMKLFLVAILMVVCSCSSDQRELSQIITSGELRVLSLNAPTTYFEDSDGQTAGFEYDLIQEYSAWLGVTPRFIIVESVEELFEALEMGRGDLIAAGISRTQSRMERFSFGPSYQEIEQQVICRPYVRPRNVEQLVGRNLAVVAATSYVESLRNYQEDYPELEWQEFSGITNFNLYQKISDEEFDCTITDSNIASIARRPFPELEIPMSLPGKEQLAWVMRNDQNELQESVVKWFSQHLSKSQLHELEERYYGHTRQFDPFDTTVFNRRVRERLPEYRDYFKKAGEEYGWPWQLLAAISYQESHWSPEAKSPTGVRGMMMLTRNTAKEMGVEDRLDPEQSIMGGARYLSHLRGRIPGHIPSNDKLWMTFAAYNIGYQHLRNSRAVAVWRDLNPNSWSNVRQALPLLSEKKVYRYLPNGFARGGEPVVFVDRIRHYYDLIQRLDD